MNQCTRGAHRFDRSSNSHVIHVLVCLQTSPLSLVLILCGHFTLECSKVLQLNCAVDVNRYFFFFFLSPCCCLQLSAIAEMSFEWLSSFNLPRVILK